MALASNDSRIKSTALACVVVAAAALAATACGEDPKTAEATFWQDAYNPMGAPPPTTVTTYHAGTTHPGPCMGPCHGATGTAVLKIAYGGVVYQADGATPAGSVQVGVSDGTYKSFVYSASNGFYWAPAAGATAINWGIADIRIRNGSGEVPKLPEHDRGADCDTCHTPDLQLPLKVLP